jgi:hypothetical protein
MQAGPVQLPKLTLLADKLMCHLGKVEFTVVFMPVMLLVADSALVKLTGMASLPYGFFDTKGYLLAALVGIVVLALVLAELKPRVMGNDFSVKVNAGYGNIWLPKNTTELLVDNYFRRRKSGEKTGLVFVFVFLELSAMFLYGTLLALMIYKGYFKSIISG